MNLKEFREDLNLSQKEMSKEIGVSISYYCKVESGYQKPSYQFMAKLKKRFSMVNIDTMFFK